jgi:asparagine synthase (glutamine-hydrolysing)
MCGIAGFVTGDRSVEVVPAVRAMLSAMVRRGPDSEGLERWPGAALGHRRLAIIDLSAAGHQPMLSPDGQTGVVFNGCIYNFLELRHQLEQLGFSFQSHCDTEVLVHGYRAWGIDELARRARGMFAFAVWDQRERKLSLVRDRLGVKPLVFARHAGGLAFASTVPALRAAGLAGGIDPEAVLEFLEFGYVTDGHSILQGVEKLAAASIIEWHDGEISQRSYWSLPEADESSPITFEEAVEETERLLLESVRLRLVADVPIGSLLSGGIDSTLVCWATAKLNANIRSYTVSIPGDPSDEGPDAAETARILGIPHEIVTLQREEPAAALDELIEAYGEPFGCSSALATLRVAHAVKRHATVLLTGDGGDDVFLGYSFHRHLRMAQRLARRTPAAAVPLWHALRPLFEQVPLLRRPKHFFDYATGGLGAVTRAHSGLQYHARHHMLGERLDRLALAHRLIPQSLASARRLLPEFLEYQQRMWFTGEFMTKVDGGTMHYSLEARSPFLDQKLWEFAATLPPELRLRGGTLKAVLREIVRKRVSAKVAFRKKRGFTIPVEQWLATEWRDQLDELRQGGVLERDGWIRPGALDTCVRESQQNGRVPTQLWHLLALERWLEANGRATAAITESAPTVSSL